jgi:chemotaxis protein methyltransferase CheR
MNPPAAAAAPTGAPVLTPEDFGRVASLLYDTAGIHLGQGKEELVKSRLARRLRATGIEGYAAYLDFVGSDAGRREELVQLVDALTTNKTSFFREPRHFDFLMNRLVPEWREARLDEVRIWSAGCSSGEEPYTLSMLLHEATLPPWRILASDISTKVLARAREGAYPEDQLGEIPQPLRRKYLEPVSGSQPPRQQFRAGVRRPLTFARLNLMGSWPMNRSFHLILCRNVMIYFDVQTRERLLDRFLHALAPGGVLMVGHSESLTSARHGFEYIQPAVYRRPGVLQ